MAVSEAELAPPVEEASTPEPKPQEKSNKPIKRRRRRSDDMPDEDQGGGAGWVMTFADLMSLLMAFFVLLFALSEVDKHKFEQLGISMKTALTGNPMIQTAANAGDKLRPVTPEKQIPQQTEEQIKKKEEQTTKDTSRLKDVLSKQITESKVEVEQHGNIIVIRLLQSGVFNIGDAEMSDDFKPVIAKITKVVKSMKGDIVVSGHTDDVPIENDFYRSNWELSTSRGYTVIHEMIKNHGIDPKRFELRGFADTRPRAPNDSAENRAQNRRVEIMIDQRFTQTGDQQHVKEVTLTEDQIDTKAVPEVKQAKPTSAAAPAAPNP